MHHPQRGLAAAAPDRADRGGQRRAARRAAAAAAGARAPRRSSRRPTARCGWPAASRCGLADPAAPRPRPRTAAARPRPARGPGRRDRHRAPGRRPGRRDPSRPRAARGRADHAGLVAGGAARGGRRRRQRLDRATSTTTARPSSGSSTRCAWRRAGCRRTTTAPRTSGPSRCTGSRRCAPSRAERGAQLAEVDRGSAGRLRGQRRCRGTRGTPRTRRPASAGPGASPARGRSQVVAGSRGSCPSSTPSATIRSPRAWVRSTVERTIATARTRRRWCAENARSSLISLIGSLRRYSRRAVAGAVVVDRQPHARARRARRITVCAMVRVAHHRGLGDLDGQHRRRHVVLEQRRRDDVDQALVAQVRGGHVHREPHDRAARPRQRLRSASATSRTRAAMLGVSR